MGLNKNKKPQKPEASDVEMLGCAPLCQSQLWSKMVGEKPPPCKGQNKTT